MKQKGTRIIAFVLCTLMIISVLPLSVFAAENVSASLPQGSDGYYLISSKAQLQEFANIVNNGNATAKARLMADVDMENGSVMIGKGVTGTTRVDAWSRPFSGIFDGNGHTISNLSCNWGNKPSFDGKWSSTSQFGLFGCVDGATIKNLTVAGSITNNDFAGGLIAVAKGNVTIDSCAFIGLVQPSASNTHYTYVGGLVGYIAGGSMTITNSYTAGGVFPTYGGTGAAYAGGIVGRNAGGSLTIKNCYTSAVLGEVGGSTSSGAAATGTAVGSGSATIENFYYVNAATKGGNTAYNAKANNQGTKVDASALTDGSLASKLGSAWTVASAPSAKVVNNGRKAATLTWNANTKTTVVGAKADTNEPTVEDGLFTLGSDGYYRIWGKKDLTSFANLVNNGNATVKARLMTDIDLQNTSFSIGKAVTGTTKIDAWARPFSGEFDGNGHTISNLSCNWGNKPSFDGKWSSTSNYALFACVDGATIKGLTVTGSITNNDFAGGLIAVAKGNVTIDSCAFIGLVQPSASNTHYTYVGGLVGYIAGGSMTITNSYTAGGVFPTYGGTGAAYAGGIVGRNAGGSLTIKNCYTSAVLGDVGGSTGSGAASTGTAIASGSATVENFYYVNAPVKGGNTSYNSRPNIRGTKVEASALTDGTLAKMLGDGWTVAKAPSATVTNNGRKAATLAWNADANTTVVGKASSAPAPAKTYTATVKADGKTVTTIQFKEGATSITLPAVPAKTGYTGKWESYTLGNSDITINAVYTPIKYTVTFKADGKVVGTATYTVENKNITAPAVPAKSGYTGKWESYTLGTANITVNAVYTAVATEPTISGIFADPTFEKGHMFTTQASNITYDAANKQMVSTGTSFAQEYDHWNSFKAGKTYRIYFKATKTSGSISYAVFKLSTGVQVDFLSKINGKDAYVDIVANATGAGFQIALGGDATVVFDYLQVEEYVKKQYTATLKVDGKVYDTVTFYEGDKTLVLPAVPAKDGYKGRWETYKLNNADITINAVYTKFDYTGKFYIDGNKIIDPNGEEFVPFGTNLLGPNAWNTYANMPDADKMINDWNFNIVRVVMLIDPPQFYSNNWWGNSQNNDIDALIKYFTEREVVVMLEFHDYTGSYPSASGNPNQGWLESKWKEMATKYKNNTYVWFNIMNEPGSTSSANTPAEWLSAHDGAIAAIRDAGADNIVICDGNKWASELGSASNTGDVKTADSCILTYGPTLINKYDNVMFSVHMYSWRFDSSKFISFVDKIHAAGMAVLCGEYGTTYTDYKLNYNEALGALSALAAYKERNVGILHWAWYDENYTSTREDTTVGGGHEIIYDKNGNPTNLSWLGRRMWNIGHGIDEDYKKAYAEIETVMADRAITSSTTKAKFSLVVNNTGSVSLAKGALTAELYINGSLKYSASLPTSVFLQKGYCFVTDELTLPSGNITVKAVIKGANGNVISDTETITFNRSGAYKIVSVSPVISGSASAFGEYQIRAVLERGTMSVDEFKKLRGSFFWDGDFIYGCSASYDSATDRLTLTSGKKFRVEGSSVNLSFRVKGSTEGTNNSMFTVYSTSLDMSAFSVLTNGDFSKGNSSWQSWGNDSYGDGYLYLKPVGGNSGAGNWGISVEAGSTYTFNTRAKVTGGSVTIGLKYDLNGKTVEVTKIISSTSFTEQSFNVTIPNGASNVFVFAWSGSNGNTATIDYIYVIKDGAEIEKKNELAGLSAADADGKFSLAIIPDTQNEVISHAVKYKYLEKRSNWLVENKDKYDLRYVIHTGDLVNWGDADESQLVLASDAMGIIDDAGIPVIYSLGNHDTAAVGVGGGAADPSNTKARVRDTSAFNKYFSTTRYPELNVKDSGKVDNAYVTFEAGGAKWLILSLELWPRTEVITWANTVVKNHSDHNVIISTHSYLNSDGTISTSNGGYGANSPKYLFDNLVKKYANIKMVFCGHVGQSAVSTSTGANGNKIVNVLGCFHANNQNPVRMLEIDVNAGTIKGTLHENVGSTDYSNYNFTQSGLNFIK